MKVSKQEKDRFLKKFGKQIKKARQEADISQEELADLVGINRTYMSRIERGISNPPIYTIHKIQLAIKSFLSFLK
ncbi:helix-turn-helix domain-containing protein [Patescibacteria group bacterium]|nr:helix-turn-helix domain-containing protein [Patescibacteria group bacterium]